MDTLTDNPVLEFFTNLRVSLGDVGYAIVIILASFVIAWIIQRMLTGLIRRYLESTSVGELSLLLNLVKGIVWVGAVVFVLENVFRVEFTNLFAALGIGSLVLSLGLQDFIKNIVAGIGLVTNKVFSVGDEIEVGAFRGEVQDITWRQTIIRDINGDPVVIPNSVFNNQLLTRHDGNMKYRHILEVEIRPGLDLDEVGAAIEEIATGVLQENGWQAKDGPKPQVRFLGSTAYGTKASIRLFIGDIEQHTPALNAVMRAIARTGYLSDSTTVDSPSYR